jgi:hypothetical protein
LILEIDMEKALMLTIPTPAPLQAMRARASRLAFRLVEIASAIVFLGAVAHHVYTFDFKPLAAFCVPIILLFFGFTSLLYNRGRALIKGKGEIRSLYAAERAMQGTVWYLSGIILGTTLYGVLMRFGVTFDPNAPSPSGLWLLLFLAPYALMQMGLLCLMRAVRVVMPQFFRRVNGLEIRRRIQQ